MRRLRPLFVACSEKTRTTQHRYTLTKPEQLRCVVAGLSRGSGGLFEQRLVSVGDPWAPPVQVKTPEEAIKAGKEVASWAVK